MLCFYLVRKFGSFWGFPNSDKLLLAEPKVLGNKLWFLGISYFSWSYFLRDSLSDCRFCVRLCHCIMGVFCFGIIISFLYIFLTLVRLHFSFCFWLVGLFLKIVVGRLSRPLWMGFFFEIGKVSWVEFCFVWLLCLVIILFWERATFREWVTLALCGHKPNKFEV